MISADDIILRYSGGPFNEDAEGSLGGLISSIAVESGALENLFPNVAKVNTNLYRTEYRAIYVLNRSSTETFYNAVVWAEDTKEDLGGAEVKIGIPTQTEVQRIVISDSDKTTGGSFTLKFGSYLMTIDWAGDTGTGDNLEHAFQSIPSFCEIQVTTLSEATQVTYDITFSGGGRNTLQPTIIVEQNLLTSTIGVPDMTVSVVQQGSPINDIATDVAFGNNPPVGVTFVETSDVSAIDIGNIGPGGSCYIWVQRYLAPGTTAAYFHDGFTLKIRGETSDLKLTTLTYCQLVHLSYPQLELLPY